MTYHTSYIRYNMNENFMNNYLCEKNLVKCKTYPPLSAKDLSSADLCCPHAQSPTPACFLTLRVKKERTKAL